MVDIIEPIEQNILQITGFQKGQQLFKYLWISVKP